MTMDELSLKNDSDRGVSLDKKTHLDIDLIIAKRIKALRMSRQITQEGLGKELGVSWQQVHKYETGKCPIKANRLYHIAMVLGEPIESFYGETRHAENTSSITSWHSWSVAGKKFGS